MSKKYNYDNMPVSYCEKCLSLAIVEEEGYDICSQCREDKFLTAPNIFQWEELFVEKYGIKYLDWGDE